MEAKELRIGNYIYDNEYNVTTVYQFDRRSDKRSQLNDITFDNRCISDYYEPIKLTDDIILKLGFLKEGTKIPIFKIDNWIELIKDINKEGYIFYCRGTYMKICEYAHEIQNLYFALTGEELTLKTQ